jgi:hypothetical protein
MSIRIRNRKPNMVLGLNNQGLVVNFPSEVVLKEVPASQLKATEIKIKQILDDSANKKVIAFTDKLGKVVLWEGAAYDAIGQWTDTDVETRILELYGPK